MNDNAYIEELTGIIMAFSNPDSEVAKDTAKRITDWHREQGLRVVPYEPTKDMLETGANEHIRPISTAVHGAKATYQAMLDAAKGDGDE